MSEFRNAKGNVCFIFRQCNKEVINALYDGHEIIIQTYAGLDDFVCELISLKFICVINRSRCIAHILNGFYFGKIYDVDVLALRDSELHTEELF